MWAVQGRIEKCIQNVRKPEGKKPLERLGHRGEDNIKMELKQGVDWIHLAQERNQWWALVDVAMKLRVS